MPKIKAKMVNVNDVRPGPYVRTHLEPDLMARVTKIFEIIKGGIPEETAEEFADDFLRDIRPENEIRIWEKIARTYQNTVESVSVSKEELIAAISLITMAGEEAANKTTLNLDQFNFVYATYLRMATN